MRKWLGLEPPTDPSGLPLFQRIAESLVREVERGRLLAGEKLPSSRDLAKELGVNRNTIVAAFSELVAQGYAESRPPQGTFVASSLPIPKLPPPKKGKRKPVVLDFPKAPFWPGFSEIGPNELALLGGVPDMRPFPRDAWARVVRKAMSDRTGTLGYGSERGNARFLLNLARYLATTRGVVCSEEEIMSTRGSQQALHLAARAAVEPGKVICVERYGYRPAWEAFELAGARLVPIATDDEGLVTSELEEATRKHPVRAVYVTPHHQYPTMKTMTPARRRELLSLAKDRRFLVIEDDYDHEFHFEGRPILPLKARDDDGLVLHVGTFSKILAPGLRLGYVVGQPELVRRMLAYRAFLDRQGDLTTELALAFFMEEGEFGAHVRRMFRLYAERREALLEGLSERFAGELSFEPPRGGLSVWAKCKTRDAREWALRAEKAGVLVYPGERFSFEGRNEPFLRIGFACHTPKELERALARLETALPIRGRPAREASTKASQRAR